MKRNFIWAFLALFFMAIFVFGLHLLKIAIDSRPLPTKKAEIPDLIRVDSPLYGAVVKSPLVVMGEARGSWYFEASFPVSLLDAFGKEIVIAPAQAQGDWMTTDFVPFSVTLNFSFSEAPFGTLVLKKDNSSGLPEHDLELRIPVVLGK